MVLLVNWASGIGKVRICRFPVVYGITYWARSKVISPSPMSFGGLCGPYEGVWECPSGGEWVWTLEFHSRLEGPPRILRAHARHPSNIVPDGQGVGWLDACRCLGPPWFWSRWGKNWHVQWWWPWKTAVWVPKVRGHQRWCCLSLQPMWWKSYSLGPFPVGGQSSGCRCEIMALRRCQGGGDGPYRPRNVACP